MNGHPFLPPLSGGNKKEVTAPRQIVAVCQLWGFNRKEPTRGRRSIVADQSLLKQLDAQAVFASVATNDADTHNVEILRRGRLCLTVAKMSLPNSSPSAFSKLSHGY